MTSRPSITPRQKTPFPRVLPMRERAATIHRILQKRFETILPMAMREAGIDMWLILCQEDNLDPVFTTMIPMDTWCPILQILVFHDRGNEEGVERINISGTNMRGLFDWPLRSQLEEEQWPLLVQTIEERDPSSGPPVASHTICTNSSPRSYLPGTSSGWSRPRLSPHAGWQH
jgi:hypothetical protein